MKLLVLAGLMAVLSLAARAVSDRSESPGARSDEPDDAPPVAPLRIAVVGLVHGHAEGLLARAHQRDDVELVGVFEPNGALFDRLAAKYHVDPTLRFSDLARMLEATRPEAASIMTSIADHADAIEACATRGVHVLVEKPLAYRVEDARRIAALAERHGVLVLTNFETSWYASVREARRLVVDGEMTPVRRLVFRHGHPGPREIGCADEFLEWLTDPDENGGGALTDFGCYGAVLATWIMDGKRPRAITAAASTLKPDRYPEVDDDATIILQYADATAVIQASWAWTHDNKEMDLHTEAGSIHAQKWDRLTVREPDGVARVVVPPKLPDDLRDEWTYLRQVIRGACPVDPLSSLEYNVIVAEILDEARRQLIDTAR